MIRLRMRQALRQDDGVAMLFVIAIGFVVTLFAVAMLASVLQNQRTTRIHVNVTSAQAAAEAGLDDAVFQLGQYNSSGVANWTALSSGSTAWTSASPNSLNLGTGSAKVWITTGSGSAAGNLVVWSKGTYGANTRTIRAVVSRGSPPAFDFSMFASKGIDIHHHNSWLSPQVWTTSVHSNGYIYLDYSSEFTVNTLEAVGNLTFQKGGGSNPGGSITSAGYNWYDSLNGKCYPGGYANPGGVAPTSTSPSIVCPNSYSGNAMIAGTIRAGSVTMGSHGQVLPTSGLTLDTGQTIDTAAGDIYTGSASINGTSYTTAAAGNACTQCNKGSAATGGQVSGALHITPGYTPPVIAFPSIDYSSTYRVAAQNEGANHYFPGTSGASNFLTWATSTTGNFYNVGSDGTLTQWTSASGQYPGAILLQGDYDLGGGSLSLNFGTIQSAVEKATGMVGPAPVIIIRGSLVDETGGITINSGLVVVGSDNRTDFLNPGSSTTPVSINTTKLLDPSASQPGILAAGGQIDSSDYDNDSTWTSATQYEPTKATPVYVRGLVYSALYNASTKTSTPENQHWHNYDPKNLMKIYGAQVGADLHDCNNFSFSYDPIVKAAFGFGGGNVKVVDYQELGS